MVNPVEIYLDGAEVADRIGVTKDFVRKMKSQGKMPPPDGRVGVREGWLPATIDRWQKERKSR